MNKALLIRMHVCQFIMSRLKSRHTPKGRRSPLRICKYCGGPILDYKRRAYCSDLCKQNEKILKSISYQQFIEGQTRFREYRERLDRGEQRHICANCFHIWYGTDSNEFCSSSCEKLHQLSYHIPTC